jgi:DNA-binding NarL/FixJ family response regulator
MVNVLIVDDHPLIAEGLGKALTATGSINISGYANSAATALAKATLLKPDVILLDIKLPDGNGIEVCKKIIDALPSQKVIALTSFNQRYYIQEMIKNGAQGYLLKNAEPAEIIDAIFCVFDGETYYSPEVRKIIFADKEHSIYLSKREIEVLKLIAQGLTNAEIADKLFISPLTADSHRKNLIIKLGAKNTASLIHIASVDGFI